MSPTTSEEGAEPHLATSTSPEKLRYSASDGPALDHRYFPHIIDLIWSYLDYPAIVACAKTGSLWREKAMDYVDHVALFEFEDGSVILRSRSLDWPESAVLMYPRSYLGNFPSLLRGFQTVDIFYGIPDELKTAPSFAWPNNFIRHSDYDHWPILQSSPKEIRNATVFFEYRNGHFFFGTPMQVVPCDINSLTFTVYCESDPTRPNPLITSRHANSVISLFPWIEDVEIFQSS